MEVGPRDGLQNEKSVIPPELKIELINRLSRAGMKTIEAFEVGYEDGVVVSWETCHAGDDICGTSHLMSTVRLKYSKD